MTHCFKLTRALGNAARSLGIVLSWVTLAWWLVQAKSFARCAKVELLFNNRTTPQARMEPGPADFRGRLQAVHITGTRHGGDNEFA